MKLFLVTLSILIFVSLSESRSLKRRDDGDFFHSPFFHSPFFHDGFFHNMNLGFANFDKEMKDMTQKTRKSVANVLDVSESTLKQPNYKNSKTVIGKEGKWHTKTHARVANEAEKTPHSSFKSSFMSYSKSGEMHSSTGGGKTAKKHV
ncbi:uncharacterized protein LOC135482544 [Lineus longissimus]|uniref:uncharacterized protein LOC135482544 n=1 Tax=Lineus longissimus TaxID=88925 RepID=UPI002B4F94FE